MQNLGVSDFVLEIRHDFVEYFPDFDKLVHVIKHCL